MYESYKKIFEKGPDTLSHINNNSDTELQTAKKKNIKRFFFIRIKKKKGYSRSVKKQYIYFTICCYIISNLVYGVQLFDPRNRANTLKIRTINKIKNYVESKTNTDVLHRRDVQSKLVRLKNNFFLYDP